MGLGNIVGKLGISTALDITCPNAEFVATRVQLLSNARARWVVDLGKFPALLFTTAKSL